jgi:hypothetical protein
MAGWKLTSRRRISERFPLLGRRLFLAALAVGVCPRHASGAATDAPPPTLADTGLYADFAAKKIAPGVRPYSPQYPLWSDGALKRRWISLPPGATIDASDPDAWSFPVGTRVWKEFSFSRRIETRFMEKTADGEWLFATYRWNEMQTEALLAPERGIRYAAESRPGVPYGIPGVVECRACHMSGTSPVLGFSTLQLSSDRDPGALHAIPPDPGSLDLEQLIRDGLLVGLPAPIAAHPPRVRATNATERTALGYLHANCSNCHNLRSPIAGLGLSFFVHADGTSDALTTAVGRTSHYEPTGTEIHTRIVPGDPSDSLVIARVSSRGTARQMPPMDTHLVDDEGLALLKRWIAHERAPSKQSGNHESMPSPAPPGGSAQKEEP